MRKLTPKCRYLLLVFSKNVSYQRCIFRFFQQKCHLSTKKCHLSTKKCHLFGQKYHLSKEEVSRHHLSYHSWCALWFSLVENVVFSYRKRCFQLLKFRHCCHCCHIAPAPEMPYFKGISTNLWQQWQQFHENQNCWYTRISYGIYDRYSL